MKRRSTLIHDKSVNVPQHFLQLTLAWLKIQGLNAVREERLTFGLDELPKEVCFSCNHTAPARERFFYKSHENHQVRRVLKQSNELHIRWASEAPYSVASPLNSRISPGLHVHFTPLGEHKPSDCLVPDVLLPCVLTFLQEISFAHSSTNSFRRN